MARKVTLYLEAHYQEDLLLDDIAEALTQQKLSLRSVQKRYQYYHFGLLEYNPDPLRVTTIIENLRK